MIAAGFSWFHLIPSVDDGSLLPAWIGDGAHTHVYVLTAMVCLLLIGFALIGRLGLERAKARDGLSRFNTGTSLSPLVFGELFAEMLMGLMGNMLSKEDVRKFFPLIAGLFLYIFSCNILAVIPGFLPPTDYLNTNVGMALISFVIFNAVGLWRDPVGYIKHLMGPVWWLVFLLLPIEIISLLVRPAALMIRLTGNMYGDHQAFTVLSSLVPYPVFYPVALLVLACLVSAIQALVFSLLTTVYISLAVPHHEHEHSH